MPQKIGIPRTLGYYDYYPFWQTFLENIGLQVIASTNSNKDVLDAGVRVTINDACIPIKLMHGHVIDLREKADYIFLPRLVSVRKLKNETFCPKFLGLPDMVKSAIDNLPEIIDNRIELALGRLERFRLCVELGKRFGSSLGQVTKAYWNAVLVNRKYQLLLRRRMTPMEAMEVLDGRSEPSKKKAHPLSLAVIGYPYTVYDNFLNVNLLSLLQKLEVQVYTADMIAPGLLLRQKKRLPKNLFWHFSNRAMQAALYFIYGRRVDGIIHVTAFGCGPDAMVGRMIELEAKQAGRIPFLSLSVDEHTGEAGIHTRAEAFVDMLKMKRGIL